MNGSVFVHETVDAVLREAEEVNGAVPEGAFQSALDHAFEGFEWAFPLGDRKVRGSIMGV